MFSEATADTHLAFDNYLICLTVGLLEGLEYNNLIKINQ